MEFVKPAYITVKLVGGNAVAKVSKRARFNTQPKENAGIAGMLFKGVLVSLLVALVCTLFLTVVNLLTENLFVENHIRYIMIGINMISVFIGGAFAAQRTKSLGLLVGMGVGVIYVLISLAVGMEFSRDNLSLLVLANKFVAGMAAGALGGFIGVNL
jgi:putative membrane protein (TIGR04086 family)